MDACYRKYYLNVKCVHLIVYVVEQVKWGGRSQEGAGNTIGEEVEQVNSFLSRAALTTKYMTKSGWYRNLCLLWNGTKMSNCFKCASIHFFQAEQI